MLREQVFYFGNMREKIASWREKGRKFCLVYSNSSEMSGFLI